MLYIFEISYYFMFPGLNPRELEKAMKKLGVKQEEIDATEVIIKTEDKEIVITKIVCCLISFLVGQVTFLISFLESLIYWTNLLT